MKTVLSVTAVAMFVVLAIFGIQRGLRSTLSVPLVYMPSDSVVYDTEEGFDSSPVIAVQNPDGTWMRSDKWPTVLKQRYEITYVSPDWVPPYVADPSLLTLR